jgi:uncharacterized protein YukE
MIQIDDDAALRNAAAKIYDCSKNIYEIIEKQNRIIEQIVDESTWQGIARDSFVENSELLKNQSKTVKGSLDTYADYLNVVVDAYASMNQQLTDYSNDLNDGK